MTDEQFDQLLEKLHNIYLALSAIAQALHGR